METLADADDRKKKVRPGRGRVPIYSEGSPLVEAQNAQHQTLKDAARGTVDLVNKTFGTDHIVDTAKKVASGVGSIGSGFVDDVNNTRAVTGQEPLELPTFTSTANASQTEAIPDADSPAGSTVPNGLAELTSQPPVEQRLTPNPNERTTGQVLLTNTGYGNEAGLAIGDVAGTRERIQANRRKAFALGDQYPMQENGKHQVGNMEVQFDGATPEEAKKFLQDPRDGGAGNYTWKDLQRQWRSRQGLDRAPVSRSAGPPTLLTAENAPHLKTKERKSLNDINMIAYHDRLKTEAENKAGLAEAKVATRGSLAEAQIKASSDKQKDARGFIQDLVKQGVPVDDAMKQAYAEGSDVDISTLSVPSKSGKDMPKPQWIPKQFDKKNRPIEGTGKWEVPDTWAPSFSKNFNANDSSTWSVEDQGILSMLSSSNKTDTLKKIKEQYGK